jgi:hypothetical protein
MLLMEGCYVHVLQRNTIIITSKYKIIFEIAVHELVLYFLISKYKW